MQLHILDPDPYKSADIFCKGNKRRWLKMITETQQILACAVDFDLYKADGTPFKTSKARINHPVTKWVRASATNRWWAAEYLNALYHHYDGYKFVNVMGNLLLLYRVRTDSKPESFLNFAKADKKGLDFTHIDNVFEAYRQFLDVQGHWGAN